MNGKVTTGTLMRRLLKAADLDSFFHNKENWSDEQDFCMLLCSLCEKYGILPSQAIRQAQIERTYGHQLFNGTRRPSRDKVLQLSVGMGLTVEETQSLLHAAGKSRLSPRLKRDAVVIYSLQRKLPFLVTQELLVKYGLTILGGKKNGGE